LVINGELGSSPCIIPPPAFYVSKRKQAAAEAVAVIIQNTNTNGSGGGGRYIKRGAAKTKRGPLQEEGGGDFGGRYSQKTGGRYRRSLQEAEAAVTRSL
jgi:hypothetical protein